MGPFNTALADLPAVAGNPLNHVGENHATACGENPRRKGCSLKRTGLHHLATSVVETGERPISRTLAPTTA